MDLQSELQREFQYRRQALRLEQEKILSALKELDHAEQLALNTAQMVEKAKASRKPAPAEEAPDAR